MRKNPTLLTLRSSLARQEREERRKTTSAAPAKAPAHARPIAPQREVELEGVDTRDFVLSRAHARLRDAVFEGRYEIKAHAQQHARAEGFLEQDIVQVLDTGRVRAVYPEDRRWLVCGYFETHGFRLPLHVVVELHEDGRWIDVVTAFVPKHPHQVVSRSRLAVMLRWDQTEAQHKLVKPGGGRGRWKRGA